MGVFQESKGLADTGAAQRSRSSYELQRVPTVIVVATNNNNNNPQHSQLAPQLRWCRPENKPSTPHCQGRTCSSRLLWKNFGPINESAVQFLNDLGHRITSVSTDDKEAQFLFQRLSIALQRFNTILLHESFGSDFDPDL